MYISGQRYLTYDMFPSFYIIPLTPIPEKGGLLFEKRAQLYPRVRLHQHDSIGMRRSRVNHILMQVNLHSQHLQAEVRVLKSPAIGREA